jgi:hypothetical protein
MDPSSGVIILLIADTPNQALHTCLLPPQHIHCFLRALKHGRSFHDSLLLRRDDTLLEHRRHDFWLQVVFEEFILSSIRIVRSYAPEVTAYIEIKVRPHTARINAFLPVCSNTDVHFVFWVFSLG